ncbi:MAG: M48 family metalloprotease [Hahellaceae bacterium]|nr:M48 family metalloprotease [Hahellaceae bacterium]
MPLDKHNLTRLRWLNQMQSTLLLLGMGAYVTLLSQWIFDVGAAFLILPLLLTFLLFNPARMAGLVMRAYGAKPLYPHEIPQLYQISQYLSERAGLPTAPQLWYLPVRTMNAFATGSRKNPALALSDGLLRQLSTTELAGVLAHELSHIRHGDIYIMALADTLGQLARNLSLIGQIMIIIGLPLMLIGQMSFNIIPFLLLMITPLLTALMQLAISRRREFLADNSAAQLLGSPEPLMSALIRLDQQDSYWERYLGASRETQLLRTHPDIKERLDALASLQVESVTHPIAFDTRFDLHHPPARKRKRAMGGQWWF